MLKKLIIVDDDTPFRERLGRSMEKKGFFVETFASYEDCLKRCSEENFDFAVIDMRLEVDSYAWISIFINGQTSGSVL